MNWLSLTYICVLSFLSTVCFQINPRKVQIWGPGLFPDKIVMPARYFFIKIDDADNYKDLKYSGNIFDINIVGSSNNLKHCQAWINQINRKDGTFIIRYKLYRTCTNFELHVKHKGEHVADSPYTILNKVHPEDCYCPVVPFDKWLKQYECKDSYRQIDNDLSIFDTYNYTENRQKIINKLNHPNQMSVCNYVIKNNKIYRNCYGQHIGFKMFVDAILLSLTRKTKLPDMEFFTNLGDWPLISKKQMDSDEGIVPLFSWCGSDDTFDIVMPTYDITEAALENMGRITLDMLSVQGASKRKWQDKEPRAFWRGRDSRRERLDLIDIARSHPDLFNASLTNFFFFRNEEEKYGPKVKHVSFFDFFNYKYQLNIDGTVAAYRFPYLLAGDALIFKQDSKYYEFFYKDLKSWEHYVPIKHDLSDLVDKLKWAINNDQEAERISLNGQKYARENLLPHDIFCYHAVLLKEWSRRITSDVTVLDGMEPVLQPKSEKSQDCLCSFNQEKDEL